MWKNLLWLSYALVSIYVKDLYFIITSKIWVRVSSSERGAGGEFKMREGQGVSLPLLYFHTPPPRKSLYSILIFTPKNCLMKRLLITSLSLLSYIISTAQV